MQKSAAMWLGGPGCRTTPPQGRRVVRVGMRGSSEMAMFGSTFPMKRHVPVMHLMQFRVVSTEPFLGLDERRHRVVLAAPVLAARSH